MRFIPLAIKNLLDGERGFGAAAQKIPPIRIQKLFASNWALFAL
jgi:hypothetical protein